MIRAVTAQRILIVDLICSLIAPLLFYLHPRYIFDKERDERVQRMISGETCPLEFSAAIDNDGALGAIDFAS